MDSDAELLENGLGSVIGFLESFPEVGILAPRIIMPDGSTYNSVKKTAHPHRQAAQAAGHRGRVHLEQHRLVS